MAWYFLFLSFLVGNLFVANSGVDSQQIAQGKAFVSTLMFTEFIFTTLKNLIEISESWILT